jgi:hypothetical protein
MSSSRHNRASIAGIVGMIWLTRAMPSSIRSMHVVSLAISPTDFSSMN